MDSWLPNNVDSLMKTASGRLEVGKEMSDFCGVEVLTYSIMASGPAAGQEAQAQRERNTSTCWCDDASAPLRTEQDSSAAAKGS